jgi:hypothetical protein
MELHREIWNGHKIVIPNEPRRTVVIDDVPFRYGIAGDAYFLERHPHDRADTLVSAVRRYLDYQATTRDSSRVPATSRPELSRRAC